MKIRLVKLNQSLQLLFCDGKIQTVTREDARRFLLLYGEYLKEREAATSDGEETLREYEAETLAYVNDENELVITSPDVLPEIFGEVKTPVYLSVAEYAEKHGKKSAMITALCREGRLLGAIKKGVGGLYQKTHHTPKMPA